MVQSFDQLIDRQNRILDGKAPLLQLPCQERGLGNIQAEAFELLYLGKNLPGRPSHHDFPMIHDNHTVCKNCLFHIVGDQDDRHILRPVQLPDRSDHLFAPARVEHCGSFIQHDALRMHGNHARDRDTLLLSPAQAVRRPSSHFPHAHCPERLFHPFPDVRRRNPLVLQPEAHILLHYGSNDLVVRILEHHARTLTDLPDISRIQGIIPIYIQRPAIRHKKGIQMPGKRGFPRSIVTQNRNELPLLHIYVNPVQRGAALSRIALTVIDRIVEGQVMSFYDPIRFLPCHIVSSGNPRSPCPMPGPHCSRESSSILHAARIWRNKKVPAAPFSRPGA